MKKIARWLLVVGIATATVFSASSQEKPLTPAQKRKLERQQAQAAYGLQLEQAIAKGEFYFRGRDMQISNLDRVTLRAPYDFVELQPGKLTLRLPYFTSENTMGGTWPILDFECTDFNYTVKEQQGSYSITVKANKVVNRSTVGNAVQSQSYMLLFTLSASDPTARLTITPNFTGAVHYTGEVTLD